MGWLSGWKYRRSHVVNSAANAEANYQVKIKTLYGFTSFGHTTAETSTFTGTLDNMIRGSVFTTSTGGIVHYIKAYLQLTAGAAYHKVKCAIYKHADGTLVPNSETDEVTVTSEAWTWITFSYSDSKPVLEADTEYVLVAWSEDADGSVKLGYHIGAEDQGHYVSATYNGFPSSVTFSHTNGEYSIYAEIDPSQNNTVSLLEHCRTDFGDVRFTGKDASGNNPETNLLDYWIEEKVDGDYAVFWVELQYSLDSENQTIYIYYGNSTAATTSNGDNTFLFFDDFSGTSLDSNKWDLIEGSVEVSNGNLVLTGTTGTRGRIEGKTVVSKPVAFHSRVKWSGNTLQYCTFCGMRKKGVSNVFIANFGTSSPSTVRLQCNTASGSDQSDYSVTTPTNYHIYKTTWKTDEAKVYFDDTLKATITDYVPTDDMAAYLREGNTADQIAYVDWYFIRKWVDPEPSHGSWGSEETGLIPVVMHHYSFLNSRRI